jgi:hypothetical protein
MYENPSYVLDLLLQYFVNCHNKGVNEENPYIQNNEAVLTFVYDNHISKTLNDRKESSDMLLMIQKLLDDKYIYSIPSDNNVLTYKITFDGLVFHQKGGYDQQRKNNQAEIDYIKRLATKTEDNTLFQTASQKKINLLTFFVALGTLIAACYYLEEILKFVEKEKCLGFRYYLLYFVSFGLLVLLIFHFLKKMKEEK